MASYRPRRSRAFLVTSSLVLSFAYVAVAVGLWLIQSGKIETTADTVSATAVCAPPTQVTDTFGAERTDGGEIKPAGWTADAGQILRGWNVGGSSRAARDVHTMSLNAADIGVGSGGNVRATKLTRETKDGSIHLVFYGTTPQPINHGASPPFYPPPYTVNFSLLLKNQPALSFRITNPAAKFDPTSGALLEPQVATFQAFDPITEQFQNVMAHLPAVPALGTPARDGAFTPGSIEQLGDYSVTRYDLTLTWTGGNSVTVAGDGLTSFPLKLVASDPKSVIGLALTGGHWVSVEYPAGTSGPCLTGLAPNQGPGSTEVTLSGSQFEATGMKVTLKPTNGETITLQSDLTISADGKSLKFKVPIGTPLGPYQVGVTSSTGPSGQTHTFTVTDKAAPTPTPSTLSLAVDPLSGVAPLTVRGNASGVPNSSNTSISCATSDAALTVSEGFESFKDGTTDFGWTITPHPGTTVAIKATAGKTGNGIELVDSNATAGYAHQAELARSFREQSEGSLTLDVQPKQTSGRFQLGFYTKDGQDGGLLYFAPGGGFQYWDYQIPGGYIGIGSQSYKANQWYTVRIAWKGASYDVFIDNQKLNASPLPFLYRGRTTSPVNNVQLVTGWGGADTGTFLVDNVSVPGCSSAPLLTWEFGDGSAPLVGTATSVSHTYEAAGAYTLRVSSGGQTVTQAITVTARPGEPAPSPTPKSPPTPPAPTPPPVTPPTTTPPTPSPSAATKPTALVTSGGSLAINLTVALLLALITSYVLLRRSHPQDSRR